MTDFHCPACRRRVRIFEHAHALLCGTCQTRMKRGKGRRTIYTRHALELLTENPPSFEVEHVGRS